MTLMDSEGVRVHKSNLAFFCGRIGPGIRTNFGSTLAETWLVEKM